MAMAAPRDAMPAPSNSHGERVCPSCERSEPIEAGDPLWPVVWQCPGCGHRNPLRDGLVQLAPDQDDTDEGMDRASFDLLAAVEDLHYWFVTRNELIGWLVGRFAGHAGRVLEIGCGTGFVTGALRRTLPGARIAGSELHSQGLTTARRRHGESVELIQMDARRSGLRSALDLVGAFDVLEHIPEDEAVLSGIRDMLVPGGRLIATVPQHPFMWSHADDLAHHQRRYRRGELARKAKAAGLTPLYSTSFVVLAFPAMVAARLIERRRPEASLASIHKQEFLISPLANRLLAATARAEHGLRRLGLPMPFGGSQVLVAERRR
jgi:SAM-dependent methyltransferase